MIDLTEYDNRSEYLLHVSSKKHQYFRIREIPEIWNGNKLKLREKAFFP